MPSIPAGRIGGRRLEPESEVEAAMRLVRAKRVEVARRNESWTEIAEERLVVRELGLLVDSETDIVWRLRRGEVFGPKSASVEFVSKDQRMSFFVSRSGDVVFLERSAARAAW